MEQKKIIYEMISIPIFNWDLKIAILHNADETMHEGLKNILDNNHIPDETKDNVLYRLGNENNQENFGITISRNGISVVVCVTFLNNRAVMLDVVSHEISHMVDDLMNQRGLEGTECRAYLTGYLMGRLFPFVMNEER